MRLKIGFINNLILHQILLNNSVAFLKRVSFQDAFIALSRYMSIYDYLQSNLHIKPDQEMKIRHELLGSANVIAGTLSSIGSQHLKSCFLSNVRDKPSGFDCVIIDEVRQVSPKLIWVTSVLGSLHIMLCCQCGWVMIKVLITTYCKSCHKLKKS